MYGVLLTMCRHLSGHLSYNTFEEDVKSTMDQYSQYNALFMKDNQYTLFKWEDWPAWAMFTSAFVFLILFDNLVLNRKSQTMTLTRAVLYSVFWILVAGAFCLWVYSYYGQHHSFMWANGYLLEWMLSFDNLFVFHLIFSVYSTPDNLKHRPLYLGICGAVFFRLLFIFVGEYLMHAFFFMHVIFGAFLVYTGVKTVMVDEDDDDPSNQPLVLWLKEHLPLIDAYDKNGAFFVRVPVDENRVAILPKEATSYSAVESAMAEDGTENESKYQVVDFGSLASQPGEGHLMQGKTELRATMLFMVVVCLEVSDLLFAVDSVSAIVAAVNDLFLAYTSAVFAMLGLRATFFIIDVLVSAFALLKYGVAIVLVFVGAKLIMGRYYHVPPSMVCLVLVGAIFGSMLASLVAESWKRREEQKAAAAMMKEKLTPVITERVVA